MTSSSLWQCSLPISMLALCDSFLVLLQEQETFASALLTGPVCLSLCLGKECFYLGSGNILFKGIGWYLWPKGERVCLLPLWEELGEIGKALLLFCCPHSHQAASLLPCHRANLSLAPVLPWAPTLMGKLVPDVGFSVLFFMVVTTFSWICQDQKNGFFLKSLLSL